MSDPTVALVPTTRFKPQRENANKHTAYGHAALEGSIQRDGWIGAQTAAADGEIFDGSDRQEVAVATGFADALVIDSDGSRPIIIRRVDIPTATDPRAQRLSVAANRIAQTNLAWDAAVLTAYVDAGVDLSGLFTEADLGAMVARDGEAVDPSELWQGMPEFEHEDKTAFQSLTVHFKDQAAVDAFAERVGQPITARTRFLWYPVIEIERYADKRYAPES